MRTLTTALFLVGSILAAVGDEMRTWRDQATGKAIDAELVAIEGDEIVLKLDNGRKFTLLLARFHPEDQTYVTQWKEDRAQQAKLEAEKKKKEAEEKAKVATDAVAAAAAKSRSDPFMEKRDRPDEPLRTYTDASGKTIEGRVLRVKNGKATIRVKGNRSYDVPVARLSKPDQAFLIDWGERNPSYGLNDLKFEVRKSRSVESRAKDPVKKATVYKLQWKGELRNNTRELIKDVAIQYTVYRRIAAKTESDIKEKIEVKEYTDIVGGLAGAENYEFESETIKEESMSDKGDRNRKPTWSKKLVEGVVFKVKVKERELIVREIPQGFLERLEEESRRREEKAARAAERSSD